MFNNIIDQSDVINLLKNDFINNTLPNSIIFYGNKYSGKLTASLELTRILNCTENKVNNCSCRNCLAINNLNFTGLIFLSRRNFLKLFTEVINSFKLTGNKNLKYEITKIIKLISLPLNDFIIKDVFNEQEKKQLASNLELFNDFINQNEINLNNVDKVIKSIELINKLYKVQNIPVDSLRSILDWTYIIQPDIKRVVIIDHFDYLEKASQNILLKRLEEPSKNLYFILITKNINKILQTIRSRCRCYFFKKLSNESVNKIIEKNFSKQDIEYDTIEDFLDRNDEYSHNNLMPEIMKLINLVFLKEAPFMDLSLFLEAYNNKKSVKAILMELGSLIDKELNFRISGFYENKEIKALHKISQLQLNILNKNIKEKINKIEIYNLNPLIILESILYPIKAMVLNDKI